MVERPTVAIAFTGMQYSLEVSFEFARRLSAASQSLSSSFSMS